MNKITTLIAEDEHHSRERLRKLIEKENDLALIGETGNGRTTLEFMRNEEPDLVFMDIEMPYMGAFDIIRSLENQYDPAIVITTAYDDYAVKAYDIMVTDYLLKPYSDGRFQMALERARKRVNRNRSAGSSKVDTFAGQGPEKRHVIDSFLVKEGRSTIVVSLHDVHWIDVSGNYVRLHLDKRTHMLKKSLSSLIEQLDGSKFIQIHRTTVINLSYLSKIIEEKKNLLAVKLTDGTNLPLSRRFYRKLKEAFPK
jgi:two-component system LytT family response regulator